MVFAWIGVHIKFILSFTMTTSSFVRLSWYKKISRINTFWACVSFYSSLPTDVNSFSIRRPHEQQTDIIFY